MATAGNPRRGHRPFALLRVRTAVLCGRLRRQSGGTIWCRGRLDLAVDMPRAPGGVGPCVALHR